LLTPEERSFPRGGGEKSRHDILYLKDVRALAVTVLFALKRPEEVIKVCMAYPGDGTPEITDGRGLALFQCGRSTG
jgi:hypothetical protein